MLWCHPSQKAWFTGCRYCGNTPRVVKHAKESCSFNALNAHTYSEEYDKLQTTSHFHIVHRVSRTGVSRFTCWTSRFHIPHWPDDGPFVRLISRSGRTFLTQTPLPSSVGHSPSPPQSLSLFLLSPAYAQFLTLSHSFHRPLHLSHIITTYSSYHQGTCLIRLAGCS
jgi:hypothetical protein